MPTDLNPSRALINQSINQSINQLSILHSSLPPSLPLLPPRNDASIHPSRHPAINSERSRFFSSLSINPLPPSSSSTSFPAPISNQHARTAQRATRMKDFFFIYIYTHLAPAGNWLFIHSIFHLFHSYSIFVSLTRPPARPPARTHLYTYI